MYRPLLVLTLVVGGMVFLQFGQQGRELTGLSVPGMFCRAENCMTCDCDPDQPELDGCYDTYDGCLVASNGGGCSISYPPESPCPSGWSRLAGVYGGCYAPTGTACTVPADPNKPPEHVGKCDAAGGCNHQGGYACEGGGSCAFYEYCDNDDSLDCYDDRTECENAVSCGGGGVTTGFCCVGSTCSVVAGDDLMCTGPVTQSADCNLACSGGSGPKNWH